MRGKKGFGPVQLVSILLLAITALVFFVLMVFIKPGASVSEWAHSDVPNVYAGATLDNLLAQPMKNPPKKLTEAIPHPTIADYLITMGDSGSEKVLLEEEVNAVLDPLDHFSEMELHYEFKFRGQTIHDGREFFDSFGWTKYMEVCENRGMTQSEEKSGSSVMSSVANIETVNNIKQVSLNMCISWVYKK